MTGEADRRQRAASVAGAQSARAPPSGDGWRRPWPSRRCSRAGAQPVCPTVISWAGSSEGLLDRPGHRPRDAERAHDPADDQPSAVDVEGRGVAVPAQPDLGERQRPAVDGQRAVVACHLLAIPDFLLQDRRPGQRLWLLKSSRLISPATRTGRLCGLRARRRAWVTAPPGRHCGACGVAAAALTCARCGHVCP